MRPGEFSSPLFCRRGAHRGGTSEGPQLLRGSRLQLPPLHGPKTLGSLPGPTTKAQGPRCQPTCANTFGQLRLQNPLGHWRLWTNCADSLSPLGSAGAQNTENSFQDSRQLRLRVDFHVQLCFPGQLSWCSRARLPPVLPGARLLLRTP